MALSMQITGAALSFVVSLLLANLVGATGLGLYFLCVTSVEIFSTVARLGLDTAALKFISIANNGADHGTVATVYRKCVGIAALCAVAMIAPAWPILHWAPIGASHHAEFAALVPVLMVALIPVAVLSVQTESFKAIGRPGTAVFTQAVLPQLLLLLVVSGLALNGTVTLSSIFACYAGAFLVAMLLAFVRWRMIIRDIWQKASFSTAILLRTSLPILIVTSLNLVMAWTDTLVLGILSSADQVGIYGVALRISATTSFVLIAVNSVVAPQFAALHSSGRHAELETLARRSTFWTLASASPLIVLFLVFPTEILRVFGPQFEAGASPLRLLTLAQLVNVSTGLLTSLLIMTGHEKLMRNNMILSATVNLVGNLLLVPVLGALGAAISTATSMIVLKVVSWWIARRKLHINTVNYLNFRSPR